MPSGCMEEVDFRSRAAQIWGHVSYLGVDLLEEQLISGKYLLHLS